MKSLLCVSIESWYQGFLLRLNGECQVLICHKTKKPPRLEAFFNAF